MSRREQFIDLLHEARIMRVGSLLLRAMLLEERRYAVNAVQLLQQNKKWVVVIIEGDNETRDTFDFEHHATNWADGQRIRLKLQRLDQHRHMTKNDG